MHIIHIFLPNLVQFKFCPISSSILEVTLTRLVPTSFRKKMMDILIGRHSRKYQLETCLRSCLSSEGGRDLGIFL